MTTQKQDVIDPASGEVLRTRYRKHFPAQGKTRQEHRDQVDINKMIARMKRGEPIGVQSREAIFGDFTNPLDYTAAAEAIAQAEDRFQALPARVRKLASNDPAEFLEGLTDPGFCLRALEAGMPSGFVAPGTARIIDEFVAAHEAGERSSPEASGAAAPAPATPPASGTTSS